VRIVFDPAGLREELRELALIESADGAALVEHDGTRTRGALIES
jgi:hypothetical protein